MPYEAEIDEINEEKEAKKEESLEEKAGLSENKEKVTKKKEAKEEKKDEGPIVSEK